MSDNNSNVDFTTLSDDAFINLPSSSFTSSDKSEESTSDKDFVPVDEDVPGGSKAPGATEDEQSESEGSTEGDEGDDDNSADDTDPSDDGTGSETDTDSDAQDQEETDAKPDKDGQLNDSAQQLALLFKPFKAAGRDFHVESVEEAIALMQKGVGYSKKMESLKDKLAIVKTLERHELDTDESISFLIDLHNKKPEAIAKFIKDANIDPYEIDVEKAGDYKLTSKKVSQSEVELDNVLDEIRDTPSYPRTISVVSKEWDDASRDTVAKNPEIIKIINNHMETGVFDIIEGERLRQQVLGNTNGLSMLEAYKAIGDKLNTQGAFDHLFESKSVERLANKEDKPVASTRLNRQNSTVTKGNTVDKRKAAVPPKTVPTNNTNTIVDISKLSDEEFAKL